MLDGLHQGVVLRDADGTITDVNPAAEQILGRTRSELIGRTSVTDQDPVHADGTHFRSGTPLQPGARDQPRRQR